LMNDAFNNSMKESEEGYWEYLSRVVGETETLIMSKKAHERSDCYPKHIYYCASEEEVEKFHLKYSVSDVSGLSAENRFVVETSGAAASSIQETQRTINDNIIVLGKDVIERSRRQDEELAEMRMLVEKSRGHDEMKQELAELKEYVERPRGHDEVERGLADLRELVKDLVSQLKTKNVPS
ncbi:hypothetical protein BGZ65_003748, partial [Modicella reniformis]